MYFLKRQLPWISAVALGLVLIAAGGFMALRGVETRTEIREALRAEQVKTSNDTPRPGVLVEDAATARMQAAAIEKHTLGTWGPYNALPRDDPRRAQFIDGVALRTALNMAVMGFGITDLVIGAGLIIAVGGLATVALAAPALYFLGGMVIHPAAAEGARADAARRSEAQRAGEFRT